MSQQFEIQRILLASIYRLSDLEGDQYQVRDAMGQIAMANLKKIQCEQVCRLFKILLNKNLGLTEVVTSVKKTFRMCSVYYQQNAIRKIMRMKLADAHGKLREKQKAYHETLKQMRPKISKRALDKFISICRKYIPKYRKACYKKHQQKIDWPLKN